VAGTAPESYFQLDFFSLLPGFAGGRALLEKRGVEHFRQLAQLSSQRSEHERRTAARIGSAARLRRLYQEPRTRVYVELDELVTERIVPWWPHQKERQRRKRPVMVKIELNRQELSSTDQQDANERVRWAGRSRLREQAAVYIPSRSSMWTKTLGGSRAIP
jgi:hypothetical protein